MVGHGSPAMTMHYTHISEAQALQVADVLPCFTDDKMSSEPLQQIEEEKQQRESEFLKDLITVVNNNLYIA